MPGDDSSLDLINCGLEFVTLVSLGDKTEEC